MKKIAVVTGSSSGFGLHTTIALAKTGFHVIATMRNSNKAKLFQTITTDQVVLNRIEVFQLDVTNEQSIEAFRHKIDSLERLDVLVNNAGIAIGGFVEQISIEAYRKQFETNVFGLMAVTKSVLPKLREQKNGKIINLSSISGKVGFPGLSPYVSSKHAIEGYSESLRLEMRPYGVQVALVEPGSFQTNIWSSGMAIEGTYDSNSPYYTYMNQLTTTLDAGKKNHEDPRLVADLICKIASMKRVKNLRYPIGKGVSLQFKLKHLLSWQQWEKIVIRTIFKK
ncbi:short-chain dehydrogenase/reductase [Paraliobacillus quinghaiensis]|uniref:Short-chain dehydrogenase/reductase n=1 Tax=Paraliobacillus quinghaiensis TaxID=470815 RepID=A0A917TDV2_9BACI|nr:SDR family oxidoreductase [Paraliobacillus quinghaiensis]GGM18596.1 short-chain dehydrogenase/reductase [Paraliobacillus quinghaiensis]